MTPAHVLSLHPPRAPALPALTPPGGSSLPSGVALALVLLALLLQASFLAGLASGGLGGPPIAPRPAAVR